MQPNILNIVTKIYIKILNTDIIIKKKTIKVNFFTKIKIKIYPLFQRAGQNLDFNKTVKLDFKLSLSLISIERATGI